ncbi:MAG: carbohydrate kinase family protein [Planctomycetia bacterium]|nr:carbohydrate kinase family protein [Planctomycetia bacterium]
MNSNIEVLCVGIIVADHVCTPINHLPRAGELVLADSMLLTSGGCAANTAVDLSKMEVRASVVGRVGNDLFGKVVREILLSANVNTESILETPGIETSQTMIINVKGEDRRFVHTFGANAHLTANDISHALLDGIKVLYVGGYLLMPGLEQSGLSKLFRTAQDKGIITVLDVGIPYPGEYISKLNLLLPWVDVFLPNEDEAAIILSTTEPCRQAQEFHQMGAKTVVITCGKQGAVLVNKHVRLKSGIYQVEYVDGSGSGDAFDAGYITGMIEGLDERGCLSLASALGASCVRAVGTTSSVFTKNECQIFLRHNQLNITEW